MSAYSNVSTFFKRISSSGSQGRLYKHWYKCSKIALAIVVVLGRSSRLTLHYCTQKETDSNQYYYCNASLGVENEINYLHNELEPTENSAWRVY